MSIATARRHEVLDAICELETLLGTSPAGLDTSAFLAGLGLCSRMGGIDRHVDRLVDEAEHLLGLFFSGQVHDGYPGGADALRSELIEGLLSQVYARATFH